MFRGPLLKMLNIGYKNRGSGVEIMPFPELLTIPLNYTVFESISSFLIVFPDQQTYYVNSRVGIKRPDVRIGGIPPDLSYPRNVMQVKSRFASQPGRFDVKVKQC